MLYICVIREVKKAKLIYDYSFNQKVDNLKKIILLIALIFLSSLSVAYAKGYLWSVGSNPFNLYVNKVNAISTESKCSNKGSSGPFSKIGMSNPAAVYCIGLGYDYRIIDTEKGQDGVCTFPDGSQCEEWQFLQGLCGQNYSYCALNGYDIITKSDGNDSFTPTYAVCVNKTSGEEISSVTNMFNLIEKSIRSEELVPEQNSSALAESASTQSIISLPSHFDWRDATVNGVRGDWMTPVKDQGDCGACWAFATAGAVEADFNIYANNPNIDLNLSEEYLASDCFPNNNCCGGQESNASYFVRDSGIPDEGCMLYNDKNCGCTISSQCSDNCTFKNMPSGCSNSQCSDRCWDWQFRLLKTDCVTVLSHPNRQLIKEKLIMDGPLAVPISSFGKYDSNGVYNCYLTAHDHAVIITGYDDAGGYWIVKNSYGIGFSGEPPPLDGYYYVGYGQCNIEDQVTYSSIYNGLNAWSGMEIRDDSNHDGANSIVESFSSPYAPAGTSAVSCETETASGESEPNYGEDDLLNIVLGNDRCTVTARDALVGSGEHKRDTGVLYVPQYSYPQPTIRWGDWELRNNSYHDGADSTVETFSSPYCPDGTYAISCLTQSDNAHNEDLYGEDYILGITPYWFSNGKSGCNVTAFDYIVPDGEHKRMNGAVCVPTVPVLSFGSFADIRNSSRYDGNNADVETFYGGYCPAGTEAVSCWTISANTQSEIYYGEDAIQTMKICGGRCVITADDTHGDYEQKRWVATVCMTFPPKWSNPQSFTPSTYSSTTLSQFNVTWTDSTNLLLVYIESNFSGMPTNYSMTNLGGNVYSFTSLLPAGTFYWKSYAFDDYNNWGVSDSSTFTINKATPSLSIGPLTAVTYGTSTQTGCQRVTGDSGATLTLYRNGTQIATGTSSQINEASIILGAGTYNYSCIISSTQNYTFGSLLNKYRTVNKAAPSLSLTLLPSSTVTYPTQTKATCSKITGDPSATLTLYRNSAVVSNPDIATLPVGSYTYTCTIPITQNYTSGSSSNYLTVLSSNTGGGGGGCTGFGHGPGCLRI